MYRVTAIATVFIALAGCQTAPFVVNDSLWAGNAAQATANQAHAGESGYYVLLQPEQTRLRDVANDARHMYLEFAGIVPNNMQFFDGNGLPLEVIRDGGLVGVPGLHQGVLIRLGNAMSFVAVSARADPTAAPRVVESDAVIRMRRRLIAEGPAKMAMMRAIAAMESGNESIADDFKQVALAKDGANGQQTVKRAIIPPVPLLMTPLAEPNTSPKRPINWRSSRVPADAVASAVDPDGAGGYITFVGDSLRPVAAAPVVAQVLRTARSQAGVLLVSAITPRASDPQAVELARQRAEFVHQIFRDEGLARDRLTLTAVYRTDSHADAQPGRPGATVGLTFLPKNAPQAVR